MKMKNEEKRLYLLKIENDFQTILNNNELHIDVKNKELSFLMTELEKKFNFPLVFRFFSSEQLNSKEFQLFLKISASRNYEDDFYN